MNKIYLFLTLLGFVNVAIFVVGICIMQEFKDFKEISSMYKQIGDLRSIISEMADVYICLSHLQTGMFISDREINEAIMNKTERYFERRERGDTK